MIKLQVALAQAVAIRTRGLMRPKEIRMREHLCNPKLSQQ
jgi:hypothetical protein